MLAENVSAIIHGGILIGFVWGRAYAKIQLGKACVESTRWGIVNESSPNQFPWTYKTSWDCLSDSRIAGTSLLGVFWEDTKLELFVLQALPRGNHARLSLPWSQECADAGKSLRPQRES